MKTFKKSSVSVVIPTFNGKALLEKNLPAVLRAVGGAEIVVVDDCSNDETEDFLARLYPVIKVIRAKKNLRFAGAVNKGVEHAKGEFILLLNNDVAPHKDCLPQLLQHFQSPTVFAVGCKEIDPVTGKESGRNEGRFERGMVIHWRSENQDKNSTFWTSGGSMMFRKSTWEELGGLDSLYYPAYWEDIDLSYRAQKRGYSVVYEPNAVVEHHHETTNKSVLGKQNIIVNGYKNQLLFIWKNITDIQLILQHLVWLPYHLFITSYRSNGLFLKGFVKALSQLPEAIHKRNDENKKQLRRDSQILLEKVT